MNTRLLRKVAKHIAEEPNRFQMGDWIIKRYSGRERFKEYSHNTEPTAHRFASCGTAACIGGWVEILSKQEDTTKALDINEEQSHRLFHVHNWPERFEVPYMAAMTPAKRVRIAVARIEHFIKTKGRE